MAKKQSVEIGIERYGDVEWAALVPVQPEDLKEMSVDEGGRLRESILARKFNQPFYVWQPRKAGVVYCVDGYHRTLILKEMEREGISIPKRLPAIFVKAKNRKEAVALVLQYSTQAAKTTGDGIYHMLSVEEFDFEEARGLIADIPTIDLSAFEAEFYADPDALNTGEDDGFGTGEAERNAIQKKWSVTHGDLFEIGGHRLLCGDSLNREHVDRLIAGELIDSLVTDPPYGVDYGSKNEYLNEVDKKRGSGANRIQTDVLNDAIEDYPAFFEGFLSVIPWASYNTAYIFMSGREIHTLRIAAEAAGLTWSSFLVWVKNNHVLGRSDYNHKHEWIYYGWAGRHKFYGPSNSNTVLEYDKPMRNEYAPTQKPVELMGHCIRDGSPEGGRIYDPFIGAGSTMIAAEQLGRFCYAMDLNPVDVAVVLERMEMQGLKPKKVKR